MRAATTTLLGYGMLPYAETRARARTANGRRLAMACAAPFVAIAFVVGFPFVGLAMLGWYAADAAARHWKAAARFARNLLLFVAAPFIALAYALAFPFVGLAMLGWVAVHRKPAAA